MRELDDINVEYLSFGARTPKSDVSCLCSREYVAIIDRANCDFCRFVYTYKGSYDKTKQIYSYSNFVLDEEKSLFYVGYDSCKLGKKEYTYTQLKACKEATDFLESVKKAFPDKVDISEGTLHYKDYGNTWDYTSRINISLIYVVI